MKNHLTIIGGGLAGWAAAAAFAESDYIIDIFEGENSNFGSQQISPNGWFALSNLIEIEKIQPFFEPFNTLQIKSLKRDNNLEILSNLNLVKKNPNYGSIERKSIVKILKNFALKNNSIKIHPSKIEHIYSKNETNQILDSKGNVFESKFLIGADGINGISRRFVIGSNHTIKSKKIFRAISFAKEPYQLSKNLLQLIIVSNGHFVIYPTIINGKKATNYIFVPSNNKILPPIINNQILKYLIPNNIKWEEILSSRNKGENITIHKKGVFLIGEASIPMPPHIAQAGNQILEDAAFIKKSLVQNNNFNQMVSSFIKKRYKQKDIIAKKSISIGDILGAKKLIGDLRNLSLKAIGPDILNSISNPIWKSKNYE
tara:strand:+ start:24 stop:1139 length:1116 start_codon:yes stop_codon:yes gene_type:complete